jgi:hypothetical protein
MENGVVIKTKTIEGLVQVVNEQGELLKEVPTQKTIRYVANGEDDFLRCYAMFIHSITSSGSLAEVKVMAKLFWLHGNGEKFSITEHERKELCEELLISKSTFVNSIAELVRKDIIVKVSHNTYFLNPLYAFNKSTEKRRDAITFMINVQGDLNINTK